MTLRLVLFKKKMVKAVDKHLEKNNKKWLVLKVLLFHGCRAYCAILKKK